MRGPPVLATELSIVHSFHSDLKTYADAQEFCETEALNGFSSGHLFEPQRKSQNDLVYAESIRQFGGLKNTWIGIKRGLDFDGLDFWHYTSRGIGTWNLEFENWNPGQPSGEWGMGNDAHDCVHLFNAVWYNYDCNYKTFFICQFVQSTEFVRGLKQD